MLTYWPVTSNYWSAQKNHGIQISNTHIRCSNTWTNSNYLYYKHLTSQRNWQYWDIVILISRNLRVCFCHILKAFYWQWLFCICRMVTNVKICVDCFKCLFKFCHCYYLTLLVRIFVMIIIMWLSALAFALRFINFTQLL